MRPYLLLLNVLVFVAIFHFLQTDYKLCAALILCEYFQTDVSTIRRLARTKHIVLIFNYHSNRVAKFKSWLLKKILY
jgi:hypothetical protein